VKVFEGIKKYENCFETKKTGSGEEKLVLKDTNTCRELEPLISSISENVDDDSAYKYTKNFIDNVVENYDEIKNLKDDDFLEKIDEWADADTNVYTSDLTNWLNKSVKNVAYLDETIKDFEPSNAGEALAFSQTLAIHEAYDKAYDFLKNKK
jgi:hypothetical protein